MSEIVPSEESSSMEAEIAQALPQETPSPVLPPGRPAFGAWKGMAALALILISQMYAGAYVMIAALVVAVVQRRDPVDPATMRAIERGATGPLIILSALFSLLVLYAIVRVWAWPLFLDRTRGGIGVRGASLGQVLTWAGVGMALSAGYAFVALRLLPPDPSSKPGFLAAAAASGGWNFVAWLLVALAFAPIVEEVLFRGLLLHAFTGSWGRIAGAVVTTVLFVALHLIETHVYWPATAAITMLAISALAARQVTGSLLPAVALHGGYNLVIAAGAGLSMF